MVYSVKSSITVAILGLTLAGAAQASTAGNAQNLASGLRQAKATIDRIIAASGHAAPSSGGGGAPSGGNNGPWAVTGDASLDDLMESDALALPILIDASTSLSQAASDSDQAKIAFLGGNFSFGNFRFAEACNQMGLSRSKIARANTAALQPPAGFLSAFGPDLTNTVIELNNLRASEGCP